MTTIWVNPDHDKSEREELIAKMTQLWGSRFTSLTREQCTEAVGQLIEQIESCGFSVRKNFRKVM